MHTFRYIYLMPYFLLFAAEALDFVYRKTPVVAWSSVVVTAFYGLACGPLAYIVADINRPAGVIDAKIAEAFKDVPPGTRVFSPGYSTYYAFRRRGLVQIALADSPLYANEKLTSSLLDKCEYALLESEDKYAAIEESYTLYGLFRDLCLTTARRESTLKRKSILGKIGEAFAYGTRPPVEHILRASGFSRTTHSFSHSGREYVVFRKCRRVRQLGRRDSAIHSPSGEELRQMRRNQLPRSYVLPPEILVAEVLRLFVGDGVVVYLGNVDRAV